MLHYCLTQKAGPLCNKLTPNKYKNWMLEIKKYFHTFGIGLVQVRCQKTVCTQNVSSKKMLNYCATQKTALNSAAFKLLADLEAGTSNRKQIGVPQILPKKRMNKSDFFFFLLFYSSRQKRKFVRFLGESTARKSAYGFI